MPKFNCFNVHCCYSFRLSSSFLIVYIISSSFLFVKGFLKTFSSFFLIISFVRLLLSFCTPSGSDPAGVTVYSRGNSGGRCGRGRAISPAGCEKALSENFAKNKKGLFFSRNLLTRNNLCDIISITNKEAVK